LIGSNKNFNAPKDKALIIAVHHATFSADDEHSGSDVMLNVLDKAFAQSHRLPGAIFSGDVHNYQRFTRELNGHGIPYLVVGSGGHKLHKMQKNGNGIVKTHTHILNRIISRLQGK
jgi:acid phosphatase type 7